MGQPDHTAGRQFLRGPGGDIAQQPHLGGVSFQRIHRRFQQVRISGRFRKDQHLAAHRQCHATRVVQRQRVLGLHTGSVLEIAFLFPFRKVGDLADEFHQPNRFLAGQLHGFLLDGPGHIGVVVQPQGQLDRGFAARRFATGAHLHPHPHLRAGGRGRRIQREIGDGHMGGNRPAHIQPVRLHLAGQLQRSGSGAQPRLPGAIRQHQQQFQRSLAPLFGRLGEKTARLAQRRYHRPLPGHEAGPFHLLPRPLHIAPAGLGGGIFGT